MKTIIQKSVFAATLVLLATQAFAGIDAIKASNNQVGIQYVNTNVDYTETLPDGTKADTENGQVPGFGFSISVMKDLFLGNDYFQAQFSRLNGSTNYVGSYVVPTYVGVPIGAYGSLSQSDSAQVTDFSARYGKGFDIKDNLMLTPYIEIGRHEWKRTLGAGCMLAAVASCGSSEDYTNNYWGLGVLGQVSPASNIVLTANAFLGRTFSSSISGSGQGYAVGIPASTTSFGDQGLGNSTIYKVGASADYAFTDTIHGNIGLDYVSFDYGKSDLFSPNPLIAPYAFEPDSKTRYTTVKVGLGYAF